MNSQYNIVITGKPGSGKGTQAALVATKLGIPHISTGDIFREEMRRKTPLGISITESMNAGKYTSDEITNAVVKNRLAEDDAQDGFILDGYPRTLNQVHFLDSIGVKIAKVLDLNLDTEDAVQRLLLRARESGRSDDQEHIIRDRMVTYENTVYPVLDAYQARGIVVTLPATGKIADINETIFASLR